MARGAALTVLLFILAGCEGGKRVETIAGRETSTRPVDDETAIRTLFDRYWKHIANKEGDHAVACLDQATLDWNEALRKDALSLSRADFARQDLFRRFKLLQWRSEFDGATLAGKSGRELLALGIARGWLQNEAKLKWDLAYVGSNGKSGHAILSGSDTPTLFFEKEADGWKLNETKLYKTYLEALDLKCARTGLDELTFLKAYFLANLGRPPDERAFDGPLEKIEP